MLLEKNIHDKIYEVLSDPFKNKKDKPEIFRDFIMGYVTIDMPNKFVGEHGSTYNFRCRQNLKTCNFDGDIVTLRKDSNNVQENVKKEECDIVTLHEHMKSHIHFKCKDRSFGDTLKIAKLLREY